mgnify:CR=1 FL=1
MLKEGHGILDRHHLLVEACELNFVSEEDYIDLGRAGLGSCLLGGLPDWADCLLSSTGIYLCYT